VLPARRGSGNSVLDAPTLKEVKLVTDAQAPTNAADTGSFPATPRNRLRRVHDRGRYDKATIYAILDAALICHIAYCIDGQPYCPPASGVRVITSIGTARQRAGCSARSRRASRSASP
jgi:hypothetical protein